MNKADIIESTVFAYKTLWIERFYVLKLALVPVLIKFACFIAILRFSPDTGIKQALFMLPGFFAEGWLIAQFLRTFLKAERWPRMISEDQVISTATDERARGIVSCILVFVLTEMFIALLVSLMEYAKVLTPSPENMETQKELFFLVPSLILFAFSLWAFRFLWLFIPLSINVPVRAFLSYIRGIRFSFYMIGIWLLCIMPVFFLMLLLVSALMEPYGGDFYNVPPAVSFIVVALNVFLETLMNLLAITGITTLFYTFLTGRIIDFRKEDEK